MAGRNSPTLLENTEKAKSHINIKSYNEDTILRSNKSSNEVLVMKTIHQSICSNFICCIIIIICLMKS